MKNKKTKDVFLQDNEILLFKSENKKVILDTKNLTLQEFNYNDNTEEFVIKYSKDFNITNQRKDDIDYMLSYVDSLGYNINEIGMIA